MDSGQRGRLLGVHYQVADGFSNIFNGTVNTTIKKIIDSGFLQQIFSKSTEQIVDKDLLLTSTFGEEAHPKNFSEAALRTGVQAKTLSLIISIARHTADEAWKGYMNNVLEQGAIIPKKDSDSEDSAADDEIEENIFTPPPNPILTSSQEMSDIVMTPVDHSDAPENLRNEEINKSTRVYDDQQDQDQSNKAIPDKPEEQGKSRKKDKQSTEPVVIEVLTGYQAVDEEQARIRDIIVYDIPYTWSTEHILAELKLWGNTIKLSVKRQHKYKTLRVSIALSSFSLPQFDRNWTTDLGGIPVRWFPASWTLRERKKREMFQAVIHDIPEEVDMALLWPDRVPSKFICDTGAKSFKIIQTGKGKRKLVVYFENWEAVRKVLGLPHANLPYGTKLKWCQHSTPNLKKMPKNSKPSNRNKQKGGDGSPKKDNKSSNQKVKTGNQSTNPNAQKKKILHTMSMQSKKKSKGGGNSNAEVLAKILELLQKLV